MFIFIDILKRYHHTTEFDRRHAEEFPVGPWGRGCEGCRYDAEGYAEHQQPL
jgi:hypothetical protein